ncbi:uncharacterized protein V6R79_006287 [Siganus canaliculatus]
MILPWILLHLLYQGYALIPVTTVQLGEPVTFTCSYQDSEYSSTRIKWYKQKLGDSPMVITTLMKGTTKATFEKGFPSSRFEANHTTSKSTLTIWKTTEEDEAIYHCAVTTWRTDEWSGTYLSFKRSNHKTAGYTVIQGPTTLDPVHPGDSVTLQCSILTQSDHKSCPSEQSVHWFGVRSNEFHPNIIYTNGSGHDDCDQEQDVRSLQKSCVYRFTKNISQSDTGTYYCALAMCGEIIFGKGTTLDIKGDKPWSSDVFHPNIVMIVLMTCCLATSVFVMASLFHSNRKRPCDYCNNKAADKLHENITTRNSKGREDTWVYTTVVFTAVQPARGKWDAKSLHREKICTAVKDLGLDQ